MWFRFYLTYKKVYDITWRYGISADLFGHGLCGRLPQIIKIVLSDRSFRVRLANIFICHEEGVPPGTMLSVTHFTIQINSIASCLASDMEASLFIDDFYISYRSKHMYAI